MIVVLILVDPVVLINVDPVCVGVNDGIDCVDHDAAVPLFASLPVGKQFMSF